MLAITTTFFFADCGRFGSSEIYNSKSAKDPGPIALAIMRSIDSDSAKLGSCEIEGRHLVALKKLNKIVD